MVHRLTRILLSQLPELEFAETLIQKPHPNVYLNINELLHICIHDNNNVYYVIAPLLNGMPSCNKYRTTNHNDLNYLYYYHYTQKYHYVNKLLCA